MQSYHNDVTVKSEFVALIKWHREQDHVRRGYYWYRGEEDQRDDAVVPGVSYPVPYGTGCAIGCLVHGRSHRELSQKMGVPLWLLTTVDHLHENVSEHRYPSWPVRFVHALPVGVGEGALWHHVCLSLLQRLAPHFRIPDEVAATIAFHRDALAGNKSLRPELSLEGTSIKHKRPDGTTIFTPTDLLDLSLEMWRNHHGHEVVRRAARDIYVINGGGWPTDVSLLSSAYDEVSDLVIGALKGAKEGN